MTTLPFDAEIRELLAPTGKLRATINLGNPILAKTDAATGEVSGVSVDLSRRLAHALGVELELVVVDAAAKAVDVVTAEQADVGFFAIDPARAAGIAFTAAYVLIEGSYLVREDSPLRSNNEVDRAGHRVAVGKGSAYDLFLTRQLQHAEIVRAATSPAVVDTFIALNLDIAAGVKQQLESDAKRIPGLRLLPGNFMVIQQAMGLPKGRGARAEAALKAYVEAVKGDEFVAKALQSHGIQGASVAPLSTNSA